MKANFLTEIKKQFALSIFRTSRYIRENPLLNKLTDVTGIRSLLRGIPTKALENIDEIYYETNINDISVKMIDGTITHKYYKEAIRGDIHEPPITRMLKNILNEYDSPTFVDIGAHIGYYTAYVGNLLRERGSVIAIEPNASFFEMLNKNIKVNGIEAITKAYDVALSNGKGKAEMGGWEDRTLIETGEGDIQVTTFDELCAKENIKPDIIKIDVHGAEAKVLLGMTSTLKSDVKHLFLETHAASLMQGFDVDDLLKLFRDSNLEVLEITNFRDENGGELVPINEDFFENHDDRMLYIRRN